jgi:CRISPR-associated protein Cmr3
MTKPLTQTWLLAPHDPLVLGTGRRPPATLPRPTHALPLPGTLAGAMRARFVGGANDLSADDARRLLDEVDVRGPWLQRDHGDKGDKEVLVRAPAHVRALAEGAASDQSAATTTSDIEKPLARSVIYPTLDALRAGEGTLLPDRDEAPPLEPLRWKTGSAHKSEALDELVTLNVACGLLLGELVRLTGRENVSALEGRLHVTIDPASQTAEASGLYSSPGVRYAPGVTIGVETTSRRTPPPSIEGPLVLGGESRVVAQRDGGQSLPTFASYRERYEKALGQGRGGPPGLLLMLATPASFSTRQGDQGHGWLPPWLKQPNPAPGLEGVTFELIAVATTRFVPMSSWSLASRQGGRTLGRQRAVRRLVPAGTVYFLRVTGGPDAWLRACEHFWWRPIDRDTPGNPEELIAPPHRDGYGLVIPGLFWPDTREKKQ